MTLSWQATLFNLILKLRRRRYRDLKDLHTLRKSGNGLEKLMAGKVKRTPGLASAALGGVDTDRYCAGETLDTPVAERKVLLLLHGGAYCLHSPNLYRLLLAELCARLGAEGYAPNYRLAPEHPHPAGIDDCQALYQDLLASGYRPQHIALVGDSAGGGLALSLMQRARDSGLPLPCCAALLSPAGDWSLSGASFYLNDGLDPMFNLSSMLFFRALYLAGHASTDPEVSPLLGSFAGLPPLYLTTSSTELMRDIAVTAAAKAREAGGEATLDIAEGLCHDYPIMGFLQEGRSARNKVVEFCATHLSKAV